MALPAFLSESALGKMQDVPMCAGKKRVLEKKNKFCVGSVKIIHPVFFLDFYNFSFVGRYFDSIAHNGSADLRSPKKEVCFRSWDLANSQMCEVRVATSNICGCNPPNRCGKRSGADFATSVWGFAFGREIEAQKPNLLL